MVPGGWAFSYARGTPSREPPYSEAEDETCLTAFAEIEDEAALLDPRDLKTALFCISFLRMGEVLAYVGRIHNLKDLWGRLAMGAAPDGGRETAPRLGMDEPASEWMGPLRDRRAHLEIASGYT